MKMDYISLLGGSFFPPLMKFLVYGSVHPNVHAESQCLFPPLLYCVMLCFPSLNCGGVHFLPPHAQIENPFFSHFLSVQLSSAIALRNYVLWAHGCWMVVDFHIRWLSFPLSMLGVFLFSHLRTVYCLPLVLGCYVCKYLFGFLMSYFGHSRANNNFELSCGLELCSPFCLGFSPCCLHLLHRAVNSWLY